jgi:hypothetical protein
VAGEPIRGSWWGHPRSHDIFQAARRLDDDPDVMTIPLVNGKVTFVHRRLWPALLAIGRAREPWQTRGLTKAARALLGRVDKKGELESSGAAAREISRRLLVVSHEVHTERGAHRKIIETWKRWARRQSVMPLNDVDEARRAIESAAAALHADASLPWHHSPASRGKRP